MNNKLVRLVTTLALIMVLIFIVFGTKKTQDKALPELKSAKQLISQNKLDELRKLLDEIADKNPDSSTLGKIYLELANFYEEKKEIVKARDMYGTIMSKYQNIDNILEIQKKLGDLNTKILFSATITDKDVFYRIEPGDTLSKIAKKFGTTVDLIKVSNSLESDRIRANSKLKVSKAKYRILIDKSQNVLTLLTDNDAIFKVYQVSTGENNSTPVGTFKIVNKIKDPVWYTQGAIVPAESPDNILGSRWLGISEAGYGIHGTVEPKSVGTQTTRGCVRMVNSDVEELYLMIPTGTKVTITD